MPGVSQDTAFLKPEARLPTGVAGFAGFADLAGQPRPPARPVVLHHKDDFGQFFRPRAGSHLAAAVAGYFDNGGRRCHVARADPDAKPEQALQQAVRALDAVDDLDLVAVPDAMTLRRSDMLDSRRGYAELRADAIVALQRWVLAHCAERGDRFAILDALPAHAGATQPLAAAPLAPGAAMSGALYFPWLHVPAAADECELRPPCGHVAGIYARSDARVGVYKAPANEEIRGVLDLGPAAEAPANANANALRALRGRGLRVWGARTLSAEAAWRYVNVRRLVITLRRWIDRNMVWATFEPATPALWLRIERELAGWLDELWRGGALRGTSAREAYYVKCDAETNPDGAATDRVVTEIGLAPSLPAEFVVVRVVHRPGSDDADDV